MIVQLNSARSWRLSLYSVLIVLLLTGCGSMLNPFDMRIIESLGTQLSDLFVKEEAIVFEKEELDTL